MGSTKGSNIFGCCKRKQGYTEGAIEETSNQNEEGEDRGLWDNRVQYFLSLMGYTVGIGSVWRFPFILSQNGGGAFLIPFFLFLLTCGGPMYYMETCLGQFTGKSAVEAFEFCPLFKGLGFLMMLVSLLCVWYINLVSVWVYYYLYESFSAVLPWTTCDNPWNTIHCTGPNQIYNTSLGSSLNATTTFPNNSQYSHSNTPSFEFWEYKVVAKSPGLHDMGSIHTHLIGAHIISWIFIVLAVVNGVKTLGKVVYVTATVPYLFLVLMLIRGLLLDGAMEGIAYYITPDFNRLADPKVWLEAAIQVFYSLGPAWGGVITMSSYNGFKGRYMMYSNMVVASAGLTAFFNGFVVFTILGFMAKTSGAPVEELASASGPGLVFVVFPTALSQLPLPQLWSALFFLMLITVMFDSMFGMFETFTSGLIDLYPDKLIERRILVNIGTGLFLLITSLPFITEGGIYLFDLCDSYIVHYTLLLGSFFECVSLFWIYGTDRFCHDIYLMTGRNTSPVLRILWTLFVPVGVIVTTVIMLSNESTTISHNGGPRYDLVKAIIKTLGFVPIMAFVLVGIKSFLMENDGPFLERLKSSLSPSPKWMPNDNIVKKIYSEKSYTPADTVREQLKRNLCGKIQKDDVYTVDSITELI